MTIFFFLSLMLYADNEQPFIQDTGVFDYLLPDFVAIGTSNEVIFVADRKECLIHLYQFDGTRIKTIGGMGDGPDKFISLFQIRTFQGTLYAIDRIKRAVLAFDETGKFLSRFQPDRIFFGFEIGKPILGGWLCADKENLILLDSMFDNPQPVIGELVDPVRYDLATLQERRKIFRPGEAVMRFDVTKDGKRFFVYRPDERMRIEVWDAEKMALSQIIEVELDLPEPTQAWADMRLKNYLEIVGPDRFGNPKKTKTVTPEFFPGVFLLWVGLDKTLHVLTGEYLLDKSIKPLIFSLEGKETQSAIPYKQRNRLVGKIGDNYLVTVAMPPDDEIGISIVKKDKLNTFLETVP